VSERIGAITDRPGSQNPGDVTKIAISCYWLYDQDMNVSLTDELESVIEQKVKSGLYNNASEVVRDALRRAFCQPQSLNLAEDSPELAALIREGAGSRHTAHRKGDVRRLLDRFRKPSQT
jgi:putative addiction module CopG family antidote